MVASLYFHIPFCTKKCPYCHFYVIPNRLLFHQVLAQGLNFEWERQLPLLKDKKILSIYFGGGTPSLFGPQAIKTLLDRARSDCTLAEDCEITLEANPEERQFAAFRSLGINRLSLGVQSLDDRSLNTLERTHSAKGAREAIILAHNMGFENISIDLMYDLPNQTEASWLYTLDQLPSLPIRHLSLYNLTIEPHTSFYKRREKLFFPEPALSLRLLEKAVEKLENLNLKRYEISAFAHPGYESKHNLGYWTARPFLGFGPSAFSYWEKERFRNIAHLQRYTRMLRNQTSPVDFREKLPYPQNLRELFAVRLRLLEGVDLPFDDPAILEKLERQGFLEREKNRIRLTEKGKLFYDTVASEIV